MTSLVSLFKKFPTEESCIEHLENVRWKDGIKCPYCNSSKTCIHNEKNRRNRHQCQCCTKSFKVTVGTIFHNTKLDLRKWFWLISIMLNAKKGISSCQVARDLDIRQATAWSIMHRIRKAMATEQKQLLTGIFEMDETYIKSKKQDNDFDNDNWDGGKRRENNVSVVAIKQKGGDIKAFATNDTTGFTLLNLALGFAKYGSEIHTDEYSAYKRFKEYYNHKTVNHSKDYVSASGVHCNGVEGFWALLKRGIKGQFHHLSRKYLQNYINEFEFRYNNRGNKNAFSDVLSRMIFCK